MDETETRSPPHSYLLNSVSVCTNQTSNNIPNVRDSDLLMLYFSLAIAAYVVWRNDSQSKIEIASSQLSASLLRTTAELLVQMYHILIVKRSASPRPSKYKFLKKSADYGVTLARSVSLGNKVCAVVGPS